MPPARQRSPRLSVARGFLRPNLHALLVVFQLVEWLEGANVDAGFVLDRVLAEEEGEVDGALEVDLLERGQLH